MYIVMAVEKWEDLQIDGMPYEMRCGIKGCIGFIAVFGSYEDAEAHRSTKVDPDRYDIVAIQAKGE